MWSQDFLPIIHTLGFAAFTFRTHRYIKVQVKSMKPAVSEKIEMRAQPPLLHDKHMISWEKTAEEMVELFCPQSIENVSKGEQHSFGVIIGPTSTGKTILVTNFCNMLPEGIISYEVIEPKTFSVNLSKALSMKIGPPNVFNLLLNPLIVTLCITDY